MENLPDKGTPVSHQQLLSQLMHPATLSLLDKIEVKEGDNVLCLNCGEGEVAFHLAGRVGEQGIVTGIDPQEENVHTAQQLSRIRNIRNTAFCQTNQYGPGNGQQFEFIHCRLFPNRFSNPSNLMEQIRNQLMPGGIALFEIVDFSAFSSIPKNFAFERFLEMYASVLRVNWGDIALSTNLGDFLARSGFREVKHQYVAPAFLNGKARRLPSLTLESIREEALQQRLATPDEFLVLLHELRTFETHAYSMITLPGIHQARGYNL